jgi:hypothetical protein
MPFAFLLALQAGGMVVDWLSTNDQNKLLKSGDELNQAAITANIATSRLQTENDSLQAMKNLRQNLGTQLAMQAARGVQSGAGEATLFANESVGNFNADQKTRKLNQVVTENGLKAQGIMSSLNTQANINKNWNAFDNRVISKIPTSPSAYGQIGNAMSAKNSYGFGLSKVGT